MIRRLAAVLMFAALPLLAGTRVWTGAAGTKWSNPANWDGGAPLPQDDLIFPNGPNASVNDVHGMALHSISYFQNGLGISGDVIVLGSGGLRVADRFLASIVTVNIDAPIFLQVPQTWTFAPGSEWAKFAAIDLGGNTLTLDVNSHGVQLQSVGGKGAIVKRGASEVFFEAPSAKALTINAPIAIEEGTADLVEATTGDLTVASGATVQVWFGTDPFVPSTVANADIKPGAHFVSTNGAWLNVNGTVALNNATLDVTGTPGTPWLVIKNLGTAPVAGTFLGLPEGAIINENFDSYRISYTGGDGNDITLTRLAVAAASTTTTATASISRQGVTVTATVAPAATGSVSFYENGTLLGTAALDGSGVASLTTELAAGAHAITAAYTGAEGFATSRATIGVTVPRARTVRH